MGVRVGVAILLNQAFLEPAILINCSYNFPDISVILKAGHTDMAISTNLVYKRV